MIKERSWEEFRKAGLLWLVNSMLHLFGWAIVVEANADRVIRIFPARVKFRGFSEENNEKGFSMVSEYLRENINEIADEVNDDCWDEEKGLDS